MPIITEIPADLIANIIACLAKWSGDKLQRNYKVLKLLKSLNLGELKEDFASIYAHTLVEYTVDAHYRYLSIIFDLKNIKEAFRGNLYKNDREQKELAEIMFRELRTNKKLECLTDVFKSADDFKPEIKRFAELFDYFTLQTANPFQLKKYNEDRDFQAKMLEETERKSFAYQIERYLERLRDDFKTEFLDNNHYIDLDGETRVPKRDIKLMKGRIKGGGRFPGWSEPGESEDMQAEAAGFFIKTGDGDKDKDKLSYDAIVHSPLDTFVEKWLADGVSNLLVIIGEYGTGKTTFCRHLAHDWAADRLEGAAADVPAALAGAGKRIPLYFPLRDFEKNMQSFIVNRFSEEGVGDIDFPGFEQRLGNGEFVVLLDGFDEMTQRIDADEKSANFDKLCRLVEKKPKSKAILTGREEYFRSQQEFEDVFRCKERPFNRFVFLRPFSDEQIRRYLETHTDDAEFYWQQIEEIFDLHDLAKRPVLLQLIVDHLPGLIKDKLSTSIPHPPAPSPGGEGGKHIDVKIKSVDLYERCIREELRRKSSELVFVFPDRDRMAVLEKAAVWLFKQGELAFDVLELDRELNLKQYVPAASPWEFEKRINQFLTFTFLIREADNRFRLSHKSFRDYLAARVFKQGIEKGEIDDFVQAQTTPEVNRFIVEMGVSPDSLVSLAAGARDLPEARQWQGTNAANILLQIDRDIFSGRNLAGCRLRRVDFRNCDLTDTIFRGADLGECAFDKNILSAHFEGVQVERASLNLYDSGKSDLNRLRELRQLTELSLGRNQISDLSPLRELRQLTYLSLWGNQISDLSPLRELRQLTDLDLSWNQISDLAPLRELGQLTTLNLYNNQISDLAPLRELRQLTTLNLGSNHISDLTPLGELGQLTNLDLESNQISDLAPLRELRQLKTLWLPNNPLPNEQIQALKEALPEIDIEI